MINLKKLPAKEVFKGVRIIEEDRDQDPFSVVRMRNALGYPIWLVST